MSRLLLFSVLAIVGRANITPAAAAELVASGETKSVGVLAVEVRGVAPQLAKRLHAAVFDALRAEGVLPRDLTQSHGYLEKCQSLPECLAAALRRLHVDHVLFAKVTPTSASSPGSPEHELTVRLGRMPRGVSVWGPWPVTTICTDCSDTDLTDKTLQLVSRAWNAMRLAELPPQDIEVTAQDRRDKGRKLVKQAADEQLPIFYQIHLLRRAIRAGATGPAFAQLARIFFACGSYEEAEDYATQAAAKGEKLDEVLGPTLWLAGRWAEAQAVLARLVLDFPNDEHWQKALAEVTMRIRDGRSVLEQAEVELKHGDPAKAALLARIALASGRGTRAHLALAKASLATSSYADALAQLVAVLDDNPKNPEALAGKKKAEAALGKARELKDRGY